MYSIYLFQYFLVSCNLPMARFVKFPSLYYYTFLNKAMIQSPSHGPDIASLAHTLSLFYTLDIRLYVYIPHYDEQLIALLVLVCRCDLLKEPESFTSKNSHIAPRQLPLVAVNVSNVRSSIVFEVRASAVSDTLSLLLLSLDSG